MTAPTARLFRSLGMALPTTRQEPLFLAGLLLRLAAIVFLVPIIQERWFTEFVAHFVAHPSLDPWQTFLDDGGSPLAFPYGIVMLLFHTPTVAFGSLVDVLAGTHIFAQIGFGVSVLLADIGIYLLLQKIVGREHERTILVLYWVSPLVLYINYWHGQTDVVPTFLLLLGIHLFRQHQFAASGAALGLSAAAKLSMLLVLPFIFIALFIKNRRLRPVRSHWLKSLGVALLVAALPFALAPGAQIMILGNPELEGAFGVRLTLTEGRSLLVFPFAYLLLLFWAWLSAPLDSRTLMGFLGLTFLAILVVTQAAIGWFYWAVPFLVYYAASARKEGRLAIFAFSTLAPLQSLLRDEGPRLAWGTADLSGPFNHAGYGAAGETALFALTTAVTVLLVVLGFRVFRRSHLNNVTYALMRRPYAIGIAGDSGSGKDTLCRALCDVFDTRRVAHVLGDDYHRFPRRGLPWNVLTHLDPKANDLERLGQDVLALKSGQDRYIPHYDHDTGLLTAPRRVKSRDLVVVNGLHAFYSDRLRNAFDLKIFLAMDEDLRRALKIERDTRERGKSAEEVVASIEKRQPDNLKYVQPQAAVADLVFALQPVAPGYPGTPTETLTSCLKLQVRSHDTVNFDRLCQHLLALCHCGYSTSSANEHHHVAIDIYGDHLESDDVRRCARFLFGDVAEYHAIEPEWARGLTGIMQLFVLDAIQQKARFERL